MDGWLRATVNHAGGCGKLVALLLIYGITLTLLFIYGLNILYLTWLAQCQPGKTSDLPLTHFPTVTVQLPIYNERYVAARVIEAACRLEWMADRLEIQVLDDSTDDTTTIVADLVAYYRARGIHIQHLHRTDRAGYKAGALGVGLAQSTGEFIAIFDADFCPAPDFLKRTLPAFNAANVGFVQTRWGHLNAGYNLFTRIQSVAIDAHFAIEQYARSHAGYLMNFNGTAGVWRREAIMSAGGWRSETLTEDLDLSYRAQFAGWQPAYYREIVTPGEIPITLNAFRRQQHRWARGSIECARQHLPHLWRSPYPLMLKIQGTLHLTGYGVQLLMVVMALLYPLVLLTDFGKLRPFLLLTALFTPTFFAPTLYFLSGQRELRREWIQRLPLVLLLNIVGTGMMYHNAAAVIAALTSREKATFERTPKFGVTSAQDTWGAKNYQLQMNKTLLFEVVMLLYNLNTVRLAWTAENWSIVFYAGLFALGCVSILGMVLIQACQEMWQRRIVARYAEQQI